MVEESMLANAKVYDISSERIVDEKGKKFIVYGDGKDALMIEAVLIEIAADENDPREDVFVGHNGFNVSVPVGKPKVVPKFIYEVLKQGNLKNRVNIVTEED